MNRYILTLLIAVLIGGNIVKAQTGPGFDQLMTFGWDVNIPMGDSYVDEMSWTGGKFEFRKMIDEKFSLGFDLSWNSYYELKPYQTYHLNASTDATTDLYTYNYTLPMAITAHYYFNTAPGIFVPYIGLGMGAMYAQPKLYFNIYEIDQENWGFLMRPEIGTIIKFGPGSDTGLMLAARYSYSTNQEPTFNISDLKALGFNLGFVWTY